VTSKAEQQMPNEATPREKPSNTSARVRLAEELSNARRRIDETVNLSEIAAKYQLDDDAVLRILEEFQTLGMVSEKSSAVVHSQNPKDCKRRTKFGPCWRKSVVALRREY
jgi:hypothetical protein